MQKPGKTRLLGMIPTTSPAAGTMTPTRTRMLLLQHHQTHLGAVHQDGIFLRGVIFVRGTVECRFLSFHRATESSFVGSTVLVFVMRMGASMIVVLLF